MLTGSQERLHGNARAQGNVPDKLQGFGRQRCLDTVVARAGTFIIERRWPRLR